MSPRGLGFDTGSWVTCFLCDLGQVTVSSGKLGRSVRKGGMQRIPESSGGMCAKARRLVQGMARHLWDWGWPCTGLCMRKLRHRQGKPWPHAPQWGKGRQFPPLYEPSPGCDAVEQGDRATSQAGALRLRAGGLRSPGCWGGARRGNIPLDRGWALWQQL